MTLRSAYAHIELQRVYERWAGFYDYVYTWLFSSAQRLTAARAAEAGKRILEIGVGTGLVLPYYPQHCSIIGVDLSFPMIKRAQKKIGARGMPDVAGLSVMDAAHLALPSESFDAVTFPFVLTLIPKPEAALDEALRVIRPKGRIIITSRFGAEGGLQARIEEKIEPAIAQVGWSSAFKISRILEWAKAKGGIHFIENCKTSCFRVIVLEKAEA
jgi:phosphatidylethanolamine/phosphatidyl-N-methylethanolamine N-methyltransferase